MIEVREALPEDEPEARALSDAAFAELRTVYRPTAAARSRKAALGSMKRFVALAEGVLAGTVQCRPQDGRLHFVALAVAPAFRRRGVGRALIEQAALAERADRLSLFTVRESGNVAFFERLGFRVFEEKSEPELEDSFGRAVTGVCLTREPPARS